MIDIFVGSGEKTRKYHVHKGVMLEGSRAAPFFKACLKDSSGFKEGMESKVNLSEEDPDTFGAFLEWAYSLKVRFPSARGDLSKLAKLWILADKYCVEQLMNETMDEIILLCAMNHICNDDI
jgi:BTB/POZ domain